MTEREEIVLLPCPFCGGKAEWHDITEDDEVGNAGGSCIVCTACQSCGPVQFGEKDTIIEQWNRRALPPEPVAGVPVGMITGEGEDGTEVSWFEGPRLPIGTEIYAAPSTLIEAPKGEVLGRLLSQVHQITAYYIERPPTPDHEPVQILNGELRKLDDLFTEYSLAALQIKDKEA